MWSALAATLANPSVKVGPRRHEIWRTKQHIDLYFRAVSTLHFPDETFFTNTLFFFTFCLHSFAFFYNYLLAFIYTNFTFAISACFIPTHFLDDTFQEEMIPHPRFVCAVALSHSKCADGLSGVFRRVKAQAG